MDILNPLRETREIASVLYDLTSSIDGAPLTAILTEEIVTQIQTGVRLVKGQLVMLVARIGDGTVLTSTIGIVTKVERYSNTNPASVTYTFKMLLGKADSIDDISNEIIIQGEQLAERVDVVVTPDVKSFITDTLFGVERLEFKTKLGIKHIFILNNDKFDSLF